MTTRKMFISLIPLSYWLEIWNIFILLNFLENLRKFIDLHFYNLFKIFDNGTKIVCDQIVYLYYIPSQPRFWKKRSAN